jgi:hypothetical protein
MLEVIFVEAPSQNKVGIWHPAVGLRCRIPHMSGKDPGNTIDLNSTYPEIEVLSSWIFSIFKLDFDHVTAVSSLMDRL